MPDEEKSHTYRLEVTDAEYQVIHILRSLAPHDKMEVFRSGNRWSVIMHRSYKEEIPINGPQTEAKGKHPKPA